MDIHLPRHLYKYAPLAVCHTDPNGKQVTGFDAVEDILTKNRIYYSNPRNFNDPFEFDRVVEDLAQQDRDVIINGLIQGLTPDAANRIAQECISPSDIEAMFNTEMDRMAISQHSRCTDSIIHRCGYISLCDSNHNVLMWSHYADAHRGLCLRFTCRNDLFYEDNGAGRIGKVEYGDTVVRMEVGQDAEPDAVFHRIFRKAECWQYENEYRLYKVPSSETTGDAQGNSLFNSELVDEVYFGLRTPEEDIDTILGFVALAKHDIKVYRAQKSERSLELTFTIIEQ